MTRYTIVPSYVYLYNKWGAPDPSRGQPLDGFTGSDTHNTEDEKVPVGTILRVPCTTTYGFADMIYLQADDTIVAAGTICVPSSATNLTKVTNLKGADVGNSSLSGLLAVSLSAMTADYYGWFWVGGPCPIDYVSALTYAPAEQTIAAGDPLAIMEATSSSYTYGEFAFIEATTAGIAIVGLAMTASA